MSSDNPYSSPITRVAKEIRPVPLAAIARSTFLAWEKLRVVYVATLAVVTLLLGLLVPSNLLASVHCWGLVVEGAIIANVCYFVGPVIETYLTWLGFRASSLRMVMFVLGTLFSCALAFAAVTSELLPTIV